jgi:nitrate reductase gamma subunit
MAVTSSGLTATALAAIVAGVVTGVTALVALLGVLIDKTAAHHERTKGQ